MRFFFPPYLPSVYNFLAGFTGTVVIPNYQWHLTPFAPEHCTTINKDCHLKVYQLEKQGFSTSIAAMKCSRMLHRVGNSCFNQRMGSDLILNRFHHRELLYSHIPFSLKNIASGGWERKKKKKRENARLLAFTVLSQIQRVQE